MPVGLVDMLPATTTLQMMPSAVTPSLVAAQGTIVPFTLTGTNTEFSTASPVEVSGSDVPISNLQVINPTTVTGSFKVATKAAAGTRMVTSLPVTYAVTGPATVSGSSLTVTGTSSVRVTASQAWDNTYAKATSVAQTFSVKAATTTSASISCTSFASSNPATVSVHGSCATACGNVDFGEDGGEWGTVSLDNNGNFAALNGSMPNQSVGQHTVTLTYLGNAQDTASTSNTSGERQDFASGRQVSRIRGIGGHPASVSPQAAHRNTPLLPLEGRANPQRPTAGILDPAAAMAGLRPLLPSGSRAASIPSLVSTAIPPSFHGPVRSFSKKTVSFRLFPSI